MSSLMEAILKNQLRHVSLPVSGTWSEVKFSAAGEEEQEGGGGEEEEVGSVT